MPYLHEDGREQMNSPARPISHLRVRTGRTLDACLLVRRALAAGAASVPPFSPPLPRGFFRRRLRKGQGRGLQQKVLPPFEAGEKLPLSFRRKPQIGEGFVELRPGDSRGRPSRRHFVQRRLEGKDSAHAVAHPPRDGDNPRHLFHENGTYFIQCLMARDSLSVARGSAILQIGAEEGCEKDRRRRRRAAPAELIDPSEVPKE